MTADFAGRLRARGFTDAHLEMIKLEPRIPDSEDDGYSRDPVYWPHSSYTADLRAAGTDCDAITSEIREFAIWKWVQAHHCDPLWSWEVSRLQEVLSRIDWAPLVEIGIAFKPKGRGLGAVKKAIGAQLNRDPAMKNDAIWLALKAESEKLKGKSPIKGLHFLDNRAGKYIEDDNGRQIMNYRSFQSRVSEIKRENSLDSEPVNPT